MLFQGLAESATAIHHYHSSIISRDAIGNSIIVLHKLLLDAGCESSFYARSNRALINNECPRNASELLSPETVKKNDIILIHFSFYDDFVERILGLSGKKVLIYHNITPGSFFRAAGDSDIANSCDAGRDQLARLVRSFDFCIAVSAFNREELLALGAVSCRVLPIFVDFSRLKIKSDDASAAPKSSAKLIFVGRFAPNKMHIDLVHCVRAFREISDLDIRLVMIGKVWNEQYIRDIRQAMVECDVTDSVDLIFEADDATVAAEMLSADIFLSMSEHEGFMVPIVEAFRMGLPVVAYAAGAIPATMGNAGVLVNIKHFPSIAQLLAYLLDRSDLRRQIIARQYRRSVEFLPPAIAALWNRAFLDINGGTWQ